MGFAHQALHDRNHPHRNSGSSPWNLLSGLVWAFFFGFAGYLHRTSRGPSLMRRVTFHLLAVILAAGPSSNIDLSIAASVIVS